MAAVHDLRHGVFLLAVNTVADRKRVNSAGSIDYVERYILNRMW